MKYNTKHDRVINNKYDKKVEKIEDELWSWYDVEWYVESDFSLWGKPKLSTNKPYMNLYKEIMKLNAAV